MRHGDYGYRLIEGGVELLDYFGPGGDVTVPAEIEGQKVVSVGMCTFVSKAGVKKVTLPETVTSIGFGAFEGCTALEEINFPEGLRRVGFRSFANCARLASALLPDSVTQLEEGAFNGCGSLAQVHIPTGVTFIPRDCFLACTSLTEVEIPEGVERIHASAFAGCGKLARLALPATLTEIGTDALTGCPLLRDVQLPEHFSGQLRNLRVGFGLYYQDNTLIVGNFTASQQPDGTMFLEDYEGNDQHMAIPTSIEGHLVTRFSQNIFGYLTGLKTLSLPRGFMVDERIIPWGAEVTVRE